MTKVLDYKINCKKVNKKKLLELSKNYIDKIGFCVLENAIPQNNITKLSKEIIKAKSKIDENIKKILVLQKKGLSGDYIFKRRLAELRKQRDMCKPPKAVNDLIWMPEFAKAISFSPILNILNYILDDCAKMSQIHPKFIIKHSNNSKLSFKKDLFNAPRPIGGNSNKNRDWHTDWPHDPWGYSPDKNDNIGNIREPYPDAVMSLTIIWYLSDIEEQGGTIVVPKSHKYGTSPRAQKYSYHPHKKELQIQGSKGSVLIQDSRLWHSPPANYKLNNDRIAVVTRWSPWWVAINDYANDNITNVNCRPFSVKEFKKLPDKLKPFLEHLCYKIKRNVKGDLLKRSILSIKKNKKIIKY